MAILIDEHVASLRLREEAEQRACALRAQHGALHGQLATTTYAATVSGDGEGGGGGGGAADGDGSMAVPAELLIAAEAQRKTSLKLQLAERRLERSHAHLATLYSRTIEAIAGLRHLGLIGEQWKAMEDGGQQWRAVESGGVR